MTRERLPLVKKVGNKTVFSNSVKLPSSVTKGLLFLVLLWGITACQSTPVKEKQAQKDAQIARLETQFILDNAILEQSNSQGNLVWKIKSNQTIYSQDRQTAKLQQVTANLLKDGQIILQLSSKQGEIKQNGLVILLQDEILVNDPRNQIVVRGGEAEWQPSAQILILRQGITGSNQNLAVKADGGKYLIDKQSLELSGNVVGTTIKPAIRLQTEHLVWSIPQKQVIGDRPLNIIRYQNELVSDRIVANYGELDLQQHILSLHQDIEMRSLRPSLQIATNSAKWNYQTRVVQADQPIQIIDLENQLNMTGNEGKIDLNQQVAHLDRGIKGINNRNQSQLYARQLIWYMTTQQIEATGNVIYQQANPALHLTGDKAIGKMQDNSVIVTSKNRQDRVVTEIVP